MRPGFLDCLVDLDDLSGGARSAYAGSRRAFTCGCRAYPLRARTLVCPPTAVALDASRSARIICNGRIDVGIVIGFTPLLAVVIG